jgi:hypothetical protein
MTPRKRRPKPAARLPLRGVPKPATSLAPMQDFDPALLGGGPRSVDSFIVLLAVVYNDLRELMWTVDRLEKATPAVISVSVETGDWQGTQVWSKRYITGVLNELLVAVELAHKAKILDSPDFVRVLKGLTADERQAWDNIADAALQRKGRASQLRQFFGLVRNRAAFHYDRGRLWSGYEQHFRGLSPSEYNRRAYFSVGETLGATRFYFADAAAQQALEMFDADQDLWPMANVVVKSVNVALRGVVAEHLRRRIASAKSSTLNDTNEKGGA